MFTAKPHQLANARHLVGCLRTYGGAIDMSDTGTGKSVTALLMCKAVNARPLVITRKAVISGWENDCKMVGVEPLAIVNYEAAKRPSFDFGKLEVIRRKRPTPEDPIGEPMAYRYTWRKDLGRVILVFDESQNCASMASQNSKLLLSAAQTYKTLLLSATPFATPLQAGPQMCALRLTTPTEQLKWLHNMGCRPNNFGAWEFIGDRKDRLKDEPGTNAQAGREIMNALHMALLPAHGVRTRREEIPDFPQTQITTHLVECPAPSEVIRGYIDAINEARAMDLERVKEQLPPELWEMAEVLPVVEDLRNRQESEILKLPIIEEMVEDALAKGDSVGIFLNFDLSIKALAKRLGVSNIIRGNRKKEKNNFDRAKNIYRFRTNQDRIQIVNSAAGGAGMSMHDSVTKVPRTTIISPPWSALVLKQVFGRPHRLEGGYSQQKVVFAKGTVEERVYHRVTNRLGNIEALTDGDLINL